MMMMAVAQARGVPASTVDLWISESQRNVIIMRSTQSIYQGRGHHLHRTSTISHHWILASKT